MPTLLLLLGLLSADGLAQSFPAAPPPAAAAPLVLPGGVTAQRLQGLLQGFVTAEYGRVFRHLGDERDFDHGHLLLVDGRPVAILYHTQETGFAPSSPDFAYLDASRRNWLQWLDGGALEDARRYERARYPETASWEWFVRRQLPELRKRHTVTDRMLDPELLGGRALESVQWVFTRVECGTAAKSRAANVISVALPNAERVCLSLSAS